MDGDVWQHFWKAIIDKGLGATKVVKVKGHAKWSDVRSGTVAWADKRGNDAADVLARRGAKAHAIDEAFESKLRAALGGSGLCDDVRHGGSA